MIHKIFTLMIIALAMSTVPCVAGGNLGFLSSDLRSLDPQVWDYLDAVGNQEFIKTKVINDVTDPQVQMRLLRSYALALTIERNDLELFQEWLTNPREGMELGYEAAMLAAAAFGLLEIVEDLITNHGVVATARKNEAIIQAAYHNHPQIIEFLKDQGSDVRDQNYRAFLGAVIQGHDFVVDLLVALMREDAVRIPENVVAKLIEIAQQLKKEKPDKAQSYTEIINTLNEYHKQIYRPAQIEHPAKRRRADVSTRN